ncbi:MAG: hypothetical protein AAGG02_06550 [Cyanobacteria bacterium P01_H01_bin.15]
MNLSSVGELETEDLFESTCRYYALEGVLTNLEQLRTQLNALPSNVWRRREMQSRLEQLIFVAKILEDRLGQIVE